MSEYFQHQATIACVAALRQGEVIAYPTEAVWGLGCDPTNEQAVQKVLDLKHRHADKGLIIVAASMEQLHWLLADLPSGQYQQLQQSWPGPITWLVPHRDRIPRIVSGTHDSIAVRVSAHPVVGALCQRFDGPIVSTSANPEALPPARNEHQARSYFADKVCYSAGSVGDNPRPSIIKDLATGKVIRA